MIHGFIILLIIKDDLSKYLNKFEKNFNLFVTSTKREYKSILSYNYGYNKTNVILTGMPRYDNLQRFQNSFDKEKKIIIMPTWRFSIKGSRESIIYEKNHSDIFIFTEYFKFYNNLINDIRLLSIMKHYNYTGVFCLHPYFESQWTDFKQNEVFIILEKCDYQKLLLKASLLITDYSSIFFDFGYIKKPVIYTHFDYEEYRNTHYKKGYFDYNLDGFGPICKDINCTINEIIFQMKNNCTLKKKYLKRINNFFNFFDQNNSERIFTQMTKNKRDTTVKENNYVHIFFVISICIVSYKFIKRVENVK